MNLDELRSVQNRERQKDSLQHLRDTFYEEVGEYVRELKEERERAAANADDPFSSPEVRQLTDEIETAEEVAESIYERRMGKLVKDASLAAAGYATDTEGLTAEEERLFEDLVARIQENKDAVLEVLAGEGTPEALADDAGESGGTSSEEAPATGAADASEGASDGSVDAASAMGGSAGGSDPVEPGGRSGVEPPERRRDSDGTDEGGSDQGVDGATAGTGSEGRMADSAAETGSSTGRADPPEAQTPADGGRPVSDSATAGGASAAVQQSGSEPAGPGSENADAGPSDRPASDGPDASSDVRGRSNGAANAATESDREAVASNGDSGSVERRTVRITSEVGEILGVDDHEYDLSSEDVVTLPEANAAPLIERDAAEPIE